jgi:PHD/YefM family antitoxin component YafN of YafNO toxin-antitoxin module
MRRPGLLERAGAVPRWYDTVRETAMIELTEQQVAALENCGEAPLRLTDPRTKGTYVLLPEDEYERLQAEDYDDSPWTKEELQAQAWEIGRLGGWEGMDEHDEAPETP